MGYIVNARYACNKILYLRIKKKTGNMFLIKKQFSCKPALHALNPYVDNFNKS